MRPLMCRSEGWKLNYRGEINIEVADIQILRWIQGWVVLGMNI